MLQVLSQLLHLLVPLSATRLNASWFWNLSSTSFFKSRQLMCTPFLRVIYLISISLSGLYFSMLSIKLFVPGVWQYVVLEVYSHILLPRVPKGASQSSYLRVALSAPRGFRFGRLHYLFYLLRISCNAISPINY